MPVQTSYIAEELRLDLTFSGNLDVSISQEIRDVFMGIPSGLRSCIIDLSGVERLFDSGFALLQLLHRRLVNNGVTVVILSDSPAIREQVSTIAHRSSQLILGRPGVPYVTQAVVPAGIAGTQ